MTYTEGTLLGGRIHYRQTASGHRSGLEPVLLAASIPARPGDRVIEAGTGAGAGLLCLGYRIDNLEGVGIERDPILAGLAGANFRANGKGGLSAIAADVARLPLNGGFDHGFANPPWRSPLDTASPDQARRAAHRAEAGLLAHWVTTLAGVVRPGGTLTFILPVSSLRDCLSAMERADCGACRVMPFWPRAGRAAKLIIVRSKKCDRGNLTLLSGLVIHDEHGFTHEADAILRGGAELVF